MLLVSFALLCIPLREIFQGYSLNLPQGQLFLHQTASLHEMIIA